MGNITKAADGYNPFVNRRTSLLKKSPAVRTPLVSCLVLGVRVVA